MPSPTSRPSRSSPIALDRPSAAAATLPATAAWRAAAADGKGHDVQPRAGERLQPQRGEMRRTARRGRAQRDRAGVVGRALHDVLHRASGVAAGETMRPAPSGPRRAARSCCMRSSAARSTIRAGKRRRGNPAQDAAGRASLAERLGCRQTRAAGDIADFDVGERQMARKERGEGPRDLVRSPTRRGRQPAGQGVWPARAATGRRQRRGADQQVAADHDGEAGLAFGAGDRRGLAPQPVLVQGTTG